MDDDSPIEVKSRISGQLLFAVGFLLFSLFLLSQIGSETRWVAGTKLAAQPRFWPAVGLLIMVLFAALRIWALPRRKLNSADWREAKIWLQPVEFVGWFMVYVWLVPVIGYLLSTLLFAPALCYRMGYRDRRTLLIAALFGIAVVVLFKGFLGVKIPGALIYEYLPGSIRSFFIINL